MAKQGNDGHTVGNRGEFEIIGGRVEIVGKPASAVEVGANPVIVGREDGCDLVVPDDTVSKRHLEIQSTPDGVRVRNLSLKNGTWIAEISVVEVSLVKPQEFRCGGSKILVTPTHRKRLPTAKITEFQGMVGAHPTMIDVFDLISKFALHSDASVLIRGESGTGKELIARAIHDLSPRSKGRFIAIDCGALPEATLDAELFGHESDAYTGAKKKRLGVFLEADGGTIFLDEVGNTPMSVQLKLLRVLETREVVHLGGNGKPHRFNVRVLAATNSKLEDQMARDVFRSDLFYRLNQLALFVPPLRHRADDIVPIAREFLVKKGSSGDRITDEAALHLRKMDWPGNVRELVNYLELAVALNGGYASTAPLDFRSIAAGKQARPKGFLTAAKLQDFRRANDVEYALELLSQHPDGNLTRMAEQAGISRPSWRDLLVKLGIQWHDEPGT